MIWLNRLRLCRQVRQLRRAPGSLTRTIDNRRTELQKPRHTLLSQPFIGHPRTDVAPLLEHLRPPGGALIPVTFPKPTRLRNKTRHQTSSSTTMTSVSIDRHMQAGQSPCLLFPSPRRATAASRLVMSRASQLIMRGSHRRRICRRRHR